MTHPRICVIGLGRFGSSLAGELARRGCRVTVIDRDSKALETLADLVDKAVIADVTARGALETLHLRDFDSVCVATGRELLPFLAVANAMGSDRLSRIHCRAGDGPQRFMLERLGIEHVMEVEKQAASHVADELCAVGKP